MKRGGPKRNPESLRDWQERTRRAARDRVLHAVPDPTGREGMRSSALRARTLPPVAQKRQKKARNPRPRPSLGPLRPSEWRNEVWRLDGGRSVLSGTRVSRAASALIWQCHHPIPKRYLPPGRKYDPRNGVVLLRGEHLDHEGPNGYTIPLEKLPARVLAFAQELDRDGVLDQSAVELLRRYHPARGAPGRSDQEVQQ